MGKTSATVKDRWNRANYDSILCRVPKGEKETIQAHAVKMGESVNGFIQRAIIEQMKRDEKWVD